MPELLGIPSEKVYDERLYRALDKLLPHKKALEKHLKDRLGSMFGLKYDLLLYDVTSTYFEGQCLGNLMAQRGYSRDKRSDCKQVCIGLVVSKCGMPLGYEVFEGNKNDVKTWQEIVTKMEAYYGKADRIWCGDRGMMSKENIEFMKSGNRKYIIGASKGTLKKFERQLLQEDWKTIRQGLEDEDAGSTYWHSGREFIHRALEHYGLPESWLSGFAQGLQLQVRFCLGEGRRC